MENSLVYHISLAVFGAGVIISNGLKLLESTDIISVLMVIAGLGLLTVSAKQLYDGSYSDYSPGDLWTYLMAAGASLMLAGSVIQILAVI